MVQGTLLRAPEGAWKSVGMFPEVVFGRLEWFRSIENRRGFTPAPTRDDGQGVGMKVSNISMTIDGSARTVIVPASAANASA